MTKNEDDGTGPGGNLPTLWPDQVKIDPKLIPKYPTFELKKAKGGEKTYEAIDNGFRLRVQEKEAEEGELLRDPDLRYIADTSENMAYRIATLQKCETIPGFKELQMELCRASILHFVNTFCWTYNPQQPQSPVIPMVTFPFQDDLLTWQLWLIQYRETGLIEKSREMGCTWVLGANVQTYLMLFFPALVDYSLSLREEDVDNRKMSSIFGKTRFVLNHIPDWMRAGWVEYQNNIDNKMAITFPDTGGECLGQLTGGTAGRSGRATRAFYDEFAFIEDSESVLEANSSLAASELFLSTVNGMGNAFARMAHDPRVRKKTLHWTIHPLKNKESQKKEREKPKYTDEIWAQEQDINYEKSTTGRVYSEFVSFSSSVYSWSHVQDSIDEFYNYDPNYDVYVGMDFGMADPTSAVFAQIKPAPLHYGDSTKECLVFFDEHEEANLVVDKWATILNERKYRYRDIVGDYRSGNQRDATGGTWIKYLMQHGIHVTGKYNTEEAPIMEVKRKLLIPGALAINRKACPGLIQAFQNWAYKVDKKTGLPVPGGKPKHDQFSHVMKATCYLIDYLVSESKKTDDIDRDWDFQVLTPGRRMM